MIKAHQRLADTDKLLIFYETTGAKKQHYLGQRTKPIAVTSLTFGVYYFALPEVSLLAI
jgi:hypothetical protein